MSVKKRVACLGLLAFCLMHRAQAVQIDDGPLQVCLDAQAIQGEVYMLYGVEQSPDLAKTLSERVARVNSQLSPLADSRPDLNLAALEKSWRSYAELVGDLDSGDDGQIMLSGSDVVALLHLHKDIAASCAAMINGLETQPGYGSLVAQVWAVRLAMQATLNEYLSYNVGANVLGGAGESVGTLADRATKALDALNEMRAAHPAWGDVLVGVNRKWRYLSGPLKNFEEQSAVPYLTYLYVQDIITALETLEPMQK